MRILAPLIMIVLLVGFIKIIWWILGAAALFGMIYLVRGIVRADRAAREARARLHAEVAAGPTNSTVGCSTATTAASTARTRPVEHGERGP